MAVTRPKKRGVRSPAKSKAARTHAGKAILTRAEVRRAVLELANTLAPADVRDLLADEPGLRARAAKLDGAPGMLLRAQLELALLCLRDYAKGRCPQIPFFTISVLTAGVAYLADQLDLVPDFIPRQGTLDDALVMALACQLGEDGIRRYCTWKGIAADAALGTTPRDGSHQTGGGR